MLVLPNTVPRAPNVTEDVQRDESMTDQTPDEIPHRPQYVHSSRNSSFPIPLGPPFTPGSTFNVDQSETYRILPIIAGLLIPFLVLLSIPSLTDHWDVQTDGRIVTKSRPNPLLLNVAMGLSMACGVLANFFLVLRFAERSVRKMTILCIILLSINELINIPAVIIFALTHQSTEGFIYGQSFWMTVCSMIVSTATNITLIIDYSHTKDFIASGSGLTHKQRSLVISTIVLICYITLGSLVQTFVLKTSFIDALYFSVVSIETIGFGDIYPTTAGTRIFAVLYISGGILNLALEVALSREALLEGAAAGFGKRVRKLRARQRQRRIQEGWKAAVKWRLRAKNLPLWIANDRAAEPRHDSRLHYNNWWTSIKQTCSSWGKNLPRVAEGLPCHVPSDRHLNLNALTQAQLEAAALEAGAPLGDLLPSTLETPENDPENVDIRPQPPLTHMRIGGMVSLLGQFAVAFAHSHVDADTNHDDNEDTIDEKPLRERLGVPFTRTLTMQDEESFLETLQTEEKTAFIARLSIACLLFIIFWMAGSVIFMTTEGWGMGTAVYFCFVAFTTVGYGDYAPQTQAGRSIFVVWALLGVATMTILISILAEAYSTSFQRVIKAELIKAGSSIEDANISSIRQRFFESRTNTMVNTPDISASLPQSPIPSQFRNVTFPFPPRNDNFCKIPSVPLIQEEPRKQNMTALSLEILRHMEKLQSLINSVKDNEILEIEVITNQVKGTIQDIVAAAKNGLGPVEYMV